MASIANAIAAADNAEPWRALLWLADQAEAGNLAPRLFTTVTMNTVDANASPPDQSLRIWQKMALRTRTERAKNMLHYHLPATASTWHVHSSDLMQFAQAAAMPDAVRVALAELARQHAGSAMAQATQPVLYLQTQETAAERQARRYQACIDAGLTMPDNDFAVLPRGVGRLAKQEGITRQSFAQDVKTHINRLNGR